MSTLTIRVPESLKRELIRFSKQSRQSAGDIVRASLQRHLAVERFQALRGKTLPFAEAQGFLIDAGLIYHWSGKPRKLTFEIIEKAYRLPDIRRWCRWMVRVLAGAKAILIWNHLQAHRSKVVKFSLAAHGIDEFLLPGYGSQLNPTEWLWTNLTGSELANFCAEDSTDAEAEAEAWRGARRMVSATGTERWMTFCVRTDVLPPLRACRRR